ncbi:MAG: phosphotransferase family protein [Xanthomonadales bacterium]|nr:phosphotransferase family protein [Xanthomonadales bacterium]
MGVEGIDGGAVTRWLQQRRPEVVPPLSFEPIPGGRSNLTYTVTDAEDRRYVLRRPPLHSVLESAHDVAREARVMDALADSDVPVPVVVGSEADDEVNGAPFFVMEFVDGVIARDATVTRDLLDEPQRAAASRALVDTLLALHDTDVDAAGLGDLGRRTGYVERQLKRWSGQLEKGSERELPLLVELGQRLAADVPEPQGTTIVHGDYRLDNLILSPDGQEVRAVLDWELCTLGDPLADVGMLYVYWAEDQDVVTPLGNMPTILDGFWSRQQVMDAYATGSSLDLSELDFYVAFAFWRLAIILEGVFQRFAAGAYEHDDEGVKAMGEVVHQLAEAADERATAAGR